MTHWLIAPWPNNEPDIFEHVWQYDRQHGTIAIRWYALGDLSGFSRAEIHARYREVYGKNSAPAEKMLWDFYNEIRVGDIVIARRGRSFAIGRGRVRRTAYFDLRKGNLRLDGMSPLIGASFIDVDWERFGTIPVPGTFPMNTVARIRDETHRSLFLRP